jgi:hypothetical protein
MSHAVYSLKELRALDKQAADDLYRSSGNGRDTKRIRYVDYLTLREEGCHDANPCPMAALIAARA